MKKSYIPPKSNLYVLRLEENIASSVGDQTGGGDTLEGLMIILFSHDISPCRKFYTGSQAAMNTKGDNATFWEYFSDLQSQGAPVACLQPAT